MSRQGGIQLTCDACGRKVFCNKLFAPKEEYDIPEDWTTIPEIGEVCGSCSIRYGDYLKKMFGYGRIPKKWGGTKKD